MGFLSGLPFDPLDHRHQLLLVVDRWRDCPPDDQARFSESSAASEVSLDNTLAEFTFLQKNAASVAVANSGLRLISNRRLVETAFTPTLWPVIGPITGQFGERLDPFSGEGAFHTGVDISAEYGEGVRGMAW